MPHEFSHQHSTRESQATVTREAPDGSPPDGISPKAGALLGSSLRTSRTNIVLYGTLAVVTVVTLVNLVRFAVTPRAPFTMRPHPASGVQQLVGPTPTADPLTWLCLPGPLVWSAVLAMDSTPGTALTPDQGDRIRAALKDLKSLSVAQNDAWAELSDTIQVALTRKQLQWLSSNRSRLSDLPCTIDGEADAIVKKAGSQKQASPASSPQPTGILLDWTADELAAGLFALETSPDPLTSDQAARLVRPVLAYQENKHQMDALIRQAVTEMRSDQVQAIVVRLVKARKKGTYDESSAGVEGVDGNASLATLGRQGDKGGRTPRP